ncbi:unnamed protein product [Phytophthora fragariaefolia]|uniref:Unnamed protein product n=1 Tax=Phytophthora fragariaefolia TaxID=1490495 RepID=A0A9W6Y4L1_9STRA|nr:unnamed protein product [Phytophthora fragariaefolia]
MTWWTKTRSWGELHGPVGSTHRYGGRNCLPARRGRDRSEQGAGIPSKIEERVEVGSKTRVLGAETGNRTENEDDVVVIHEGTDLFAEELESEMAVLPDLSLTAEVKIGDPKVEQRQATGLK